MTDIPGAWILITTMITVITPILAKYLEKYISMILDKFTILSMNCSDNWKSSVQIVSYSTASNYKIAVIDNHVYKSVMFKLMSVCHSRNPLRHVKQLPQRHEDFNNNEAEQQTDLINRSMGFMATGYNKILLDESTETYVVPGYERESVSERTTNTYILNVVSSKLSSTELLNLISQYQVEYRDYVKKYNKDGKLKYIKLKKFYKDVPAKTFQEQTSQNTELIIASAKRIPVWDVIDFYSSKSFSNVFFPGKEQILRQIDNFVQGEELYNQRGIPWNLNILMHGVPGCGKTSFIKALANKLKRHILDINLGCISTTEDFTVAFSTELFYQEFIPIDKRLIVLEDIDTMKGDLLVERDMKPKLQGEQSNEGQMNLSCFLNTLDGINEHHGRILIATTNHPEILDAAVLRRFNIKVEFTHLNFDTAEQIVSNYYNQKVSLKSIPTNLTGASLTHMCMQHEEPATLVNFIDQKRAEAGSVVVVVGGL